MNKLMNKLIKLLINWLNYLLIKKQMKSTKVNKRKERTDDQTHK